MGRFACPHHGLDDLLTFDVESEAADELLLAEVVAGEDLLEAASFEIAQVVAKGRLFQDALADLLLGHGQSQIPGLLLEQSLGHELLEHLIDNT